MRLYARRAACCAVIMATWMLLCADSRADDDPSQDPPPPVNLLANPGFELGAVEGVPEGWSTSIGAYSSQTTYSAKSTAEAPLSGQRAGMIRFGLAEPGPDTTVAYLVQRVDVTALRGHRLVFTIAARADVLDSNGAAFVTVCAERDSANPGDVFLFTQRTVTSPQWETFTVRCDLAEDMTALHLGIGLWGGKAVWVDDASLLDQGELLEAAEPARPLTDAGLENLAAFTRLLGYVRHFHPSDAAQGVDWNEFAITHLGIAEAAADPADLAAKLQAMFSPLAPALQVFPTAQQDTVTARDWWPELDPGDRQVVFYQHSGCGQICEGPNVYHSQRIYLPASEGGYAGTALDPRNPFRAELGAGVSIIMPIALFADEQGTLPRAQPLPAAAVQRPVKYTGNDRATRLAGIAITWNIIQHFYPYFDVVQVDWPAELRKALVAAASDQDQVAFLSTLRRMMAAIQDGHGRVYCDFSPDQFQIPVVLGWADGKLVITTIGEGGAGGLMPGDIVQRINGVPVDQAAAQAEEVAAAGTPQRRRLIVSRSLVQGAQGDVITLDTVSLDGVERSASLKCEVPVGELTDHYPERVCEIEPGIWYLHLSRDNEAEIDPYFPQLEKAKGFVLDFRNSSGGGQVLLQHLTDQTMNSVHMIIPLFREPDQRNADKTSQDSHWVREPIPPRYNAKVACIIDGSTQSYLECIAAFIEDYKLGELVGEASSGANGNINPIYLPGGYRVEWTGMIILKGDGSQHHCVGIQPTVPVARTIRGVAEGRDELLERALELVRE